MKYFNPRRFPSLTVWFHASKEDYGNAPYIEFGDIDVNGEIIDDNLNSFLIESFGDDFEAEIMELRFDEDNF